MNPPLPAPLFLRPLACGVLAITLLSFGLLSHASAGDAFIKRYLTDCTVAARIKPTLDKKVFPNASFTVIEDQVGESKPEKGKQVLLFLKHGQEEIELVGGVHLTIDQGGCYDGYSNMYTFRISDPEIDVSNTDFWLTKTAELLNIVSPGNLDTVLPLAPVKDSLAAMAKKPPAGIYKNGILQLDTIPLATRTRSYSLMVTRDGAEVVITLTYTQAA